MLFIVALLTYMNLILCLLGAAEIKQKPGGGPDNRSELPFYFRLFIQSDIVFMLTSGQLGLLCLVLPLSPFLSTHVARRPDS